MLFDCSLICILKQADYTFYVEINLQKFMTYTCLCYSLKVYSPSGTYFDHLFNFIILMTKDMLASLTLYYFKANLCVWEITDMLSSIENNMLFIRWTSSLNLFLHCLRLKWEMHIRMNTRVMEKNRCTSKPLSQLTFFDIHIEFLWIIEIPHWF